MDPNGSPLKKRHKILQWILDNPNLSITIVFTVLGLAGIIFANSGGSADSGGPGGDGGEEAAEGRYSDSIRKLHSPKVVIDLFDNGDTNSITYYNDHKQRVKYIERYENGNTFHMYLSQYTDSGQTDENSEYDENGRIVSKFRNVNGEFHGDQILYYMNGAIKVKRDYFKGKEIQATYYDSTGKLTKTEKSPSN